MRSEATSTARDVIAVSQNPSFAYLPRDVSLRGLLHLHLACLNYLEGNYLNSIVAAHRALGMSSKSGNRLTGLIAQADMAAAYLAVGQPARAKACLSSALQRANNEEQIFGLLLETLAEAQLVSGDLVGCAESLRCAHDSSAKLAVALGVAQGLESPHGGQAAAAKWPLAGIALLIRSAGPRESPDSQPFTRTQIEGLRHSRWLGWAGLLKQGVSSRDSSRTLSSHQNCIRVAFTVSPQRCQPLPDEAGRPFLTYPGAPRIVGGATGETSSPVEIVDQLIGLLSKSSGCLDEPMFPNRQPPLWRPTK